MTIDIKAPFAAEPLRSILINAVSDAQSRIETAIDVAVAGGATTAEAKPVCRFASAGAIAAVVFADAAADIAEQSGKPPFAVLTDVLTVFTREAMLQLQEELAERRSTAPTADCPLPTAGAAEGGAR